MTAATARLARAADAEAIARIYTQGIEERIATFETRPRAAADVEKWFDGRHPVVVIEDNGEIIAFASTSMYRPRDAYAGIAEFSVYAARSARGRGAGRGWCWPRASCWATWSSSTPTGTW